MKIYYPTTPLTISGQEEIECSLRVGLANFSKINGLGILEHELSARGYKKALLFPSVCKKGSCTRFFYVFFCVFFKCYFKRKTSARR